jgi:hypothetical protein
MHVCARGCLVRTVGIDRTVIQNDMKEQEQEQEQNREGQLRVWNDAANDSVGTCHRFQSD